MKPKVTFNTDRGRLEAAFEQIPAYRERCMLKRAGFAWDPKVKVWHLWKPVTLRFVRQEPIVQDGMVYALECLSTYFELDRAEWPAIVEARNGYAETRAIQGMEEALGIS